jgi:hypothetical protein
MPYIPKALCWRCSLEMTPVKNGVTVEMEHANDTPYYKVRGDKYQCPSCSATIVTGFARDVLAESYQDNYARFVADIKAAFAEDWRTP